MTLKKIFKHAKVLTLLFATQGRITLKFSVFKLAFWYFFKNNFCKIVHFQKEGGWSPLSPPLAAPVHSRYIALQAMYSQYG